MGEHLLRSDVQEAVPAARQRESRARIGKRERALFGWLGPLGECLLERCGREREIPCGACLARASGDGTTIYLVAQGVLGSYGRSATGGPKAEGFRYPADLIVPRRPGVSWDVDVKALTAARVLVFPLNEIRAWCREEADFGYDLFEVLCRELARQTDGLRQYRGLSAQARLMVFLLEIGRRLGAASGPGLDLEIPMGRDDIADYLGMRVETLCRVLSHWKAEGRIEMDSPWHVRIHDLAWLQARAPTSRMRWRQDA